MPSFELVKTVDGTIRGRTQEDDRAYKRHKGWIKSLGAGEFYRVDVTRGRDGIKFKKFWALLRFLFQHWEPEEAKKPLTYKGVVIERDIEAFRKHVTILAGYCEPVYEIGPKGGTRVRLEAQSISYDAMTDDDFNAFYKAVINVAIKHFLPRGYETPAHVQEVIDQIERFDS
jgi:hypothetical protein